MKNDPALVEKTKIWLGKDGLEFFRKVKEEHGTLIAVLNKPSKPRNLKETCLMLMNKGPVYIPHSVHFREGMRVRNFMRSTGLCEGWDAHDYDNNWAGLIEECIK